MVIDHEQIVGDMARMSLKQDGHFGEPPITRRLSAIQLKRIKSG